MELWDAFLPDETPAGFDLPSNKPIPDGLFHLVCDIIVRHTDGDYLLTQRALTKYSFPGLFELSAGGSAQKGETPYECAVRELREETGIVANDLTEIYHIVSPEKHTIYYGYLCVTDCDKNAIQLLEGETISYIWLKEKELLDFVNTDKYLTAYKDRTDIFLDTL